MSKLTESVQEEVKPDMTPMIDCVFLLIIFFLCIDFKTLEAKLPAYLPKDSGSQNNKEEPIDKLSLQIECLAPGREIPRPQGKTIYREGHQIRFKVATVAADNEDALVRELERVFRDRSKWQKDDKTGQLKPQPVVIEPGVNAVYGDVAVAVDAARKVGFEDIQFGGGMGRGNKKPPAK